MGSLDGKAFVFSGKFEGHTRKSIEALAVEHGATTLSGISKKADYLVAGAKMGESKRTKANKAGVPIISFEDFMDMLNPNAADAFWHIEPDPIAEPNAFTEAIKQLDWDAFHPHKHGHKLRALLTQQEDAYGVHDAHYFCSTQARNHLDLLHPYGHDDEIEFSDLSPDGRWLATGSWMSEDYERGGVLQIWEVETGRIVNRLRIHGGVGWPDYLGISWSPTSQLVGLAFDTNGIGVWDPFKSDNEPVVYSYVTDGWSRPPDFGWSNDGCAIFIHCNIDHDWDSDDEPEEARGCWMPVEGKKGSLYNEVSPGYLEDDKSNAPVDAPTPIDIKAPVFQGDAIIFFDAQGNEQRRFQDRPPGSAHPLTHPDSGDCTKHFTIRPVFPIHIDGKDHWGVAFEEGFIAKHPQYDPSTHLNLSLSRKYAWPLTWADWIVTESSLHAICNTKVASKLWITSLFKDVLPRDPDAKWPPNMGKTPHDLAQLAISTLLDLLPRWGSHVPDYLTEVGLTDIIRGAPDNVLPMVKKMPNTDISNRASELAYHCLARGFEKQGRALFKFAQKHIETLSEHHQCTAHANWAICYHLLGKTKKSKENANMALDLREPQNNTDQHNWPLVNMLIMIDQLDVACQNLKAWDMSETPFYMPEIWYNLIWYKSLDDLLTFNQACIEHGTVEEFKRYEYFIEKIIYDQCWDKLDEVTPHFGTYGDTIEQDIAKHASDDMDALNTILPISLKQPPSQMWIDALILACKHMPDLAKDTFSQTTFTNEEALSWRGYVDGKYATFHKIGDIASQLDMWKPLKKQFSTLDQGIQIAFITGVAKNLPGADAGKHLKKAASKIPSVGGYYMTNLWHMVVTGARASNAPNAQSLIDQANDVTMNKNKDLDMEAMTRKMAQENDLQMAYQTWMKIPPASRRHRADALLALLCKQKNYDGLFEIMMSFESTDLNNRGQNLVRVLQTLTRSRGNKFRL